MEHGGREGARVVGQQEVQGRGAGNAVEGDGAGGDCGDGGGAGGEGGFGGVVGARVAEQVGEEGRGMEG